MHLFGQDVVEAVAKRDEVEFDISFTKYGLTYIAALSFLYLNFAPVFYI